MSVCWAMGTHCMKALRAATPVLNRQLVKARRGEELPCKNLSIELSYGTEVPFLGIYLEELETGTWASISTQKFIVAPFTIVKGGNNPNSQQQMNDK